MIIPDSDGTCFHGYKWKTDDPVKMKWVLSHNVKVDFEYVYEKKYRLLNNTFKILNMIRSS